MSSFTDDEGKFPKISPQDSSKRALLEIVAAMEWGAHVLGRPPKRGYWIIRTPTEEIDKRVRPQGAEAFCYCVAKVQGVNEHSIETVWFADFVDAAWYGYNMDFENDEHSLLPPSGNGKH